jgi:hypothetical protein
MTSSMGVRRVDRTQGAADFDARSQLRTILRIREQLKEYRESLDP